jgi:hypothetical protein
MRPQTPDNRAAASDAIELVRQQSLTSLVQREIERRIVAAELTPGQS